jgi:predicted aspartyl protease
MSYQYDSSRYDPAAPVLPVSMRIPGDNAKRVATDALVDTGADMVCCPQALIDALGAHPAGTRDVFGIDETFVGRCNTYFLEFEVAGATRLAEVAAIGNEFILGRNLVNEFALKLDGRAQQLTVEH